MSLPPLDEGRTIRAIEERARRGAKERASDNRPLCTPINQQPKLIPVQECGARARAKAPAKRLKRASRLGAKRGKARESGRGGVVYESV